MSINSWNDHLGKVKVNAVTFSITFYTDAVVTRLYVTADFLATSASIRG
jgi:hypothetical protein